MHVTMTVTENREWKKKGWFSGHWEEAWLVKCVIIFTEEEKLLLSKYDASYVLFTDKTLWPGERSVHRVNWSVPAVVEMAQRPDWGFGLRIPTRAQADQYAQRLKEEILPKLKKLATENYQPFKGETFEL